MGSVIGKLTALLSEKCQLAGNIKRGTRSLKDELSSMDAALRDLADKDDDQIDRRSKDWCHKVRELSYDIEDCIDRFVLNHSHGGSKANFVRKAIRKVKMLWKDMGTAEEIQELKRLVGAQSERANRYGTHQCLASPQTVHMDRRAPILFQDERDLVGINCPREDIIQLLNADEDNQYKVVSIYGTAGQGKTTLAMEVYRNITES
ncbi:hypothetical protein HU200_016561 [Digitaria exilis]|uniref:Disease resistance protein n=1 Tax=Digitaria exilis TaxID=1010633 RepID=A0A835F7F9_9POAL|nr:hypothetical protein HU200_016561 [Digitaria exilis]